ncbi:DinB family protein [Larkinella soli]|uniref:DinB family protein n=1 Tax=Larkinella soli TaxID=1770527 RepID=UPI000FFB62B8|nr:DUF1572 family protein [Larkinella soli]
MTSNHFSTLFGRELQRLANEIRQYPTPDSIWVRQGAIPNSAGNLAQHLIGNLKTYIGLELGGFPYVRNREAEFADRYLEQADLDRVLEELGQQLTDTFSRLDNARLNEPYRTEVLSIQPDQTVGLVLTHLLAHLSYHTGQVNYHRRLTAY